MFFFCAGVQALSVRAEVTGLGDTHNANPSTLGVLHFLLVVEGQGGYPRDSWIRRQVCSADAGVGHAWKAAGEGRGLGHTMYVGMSSRGCLCHQQ